MAFGDVVSFGSISKTVHGAGDELELGILGERASASWAFERPDVIVWGRERSRSTEARTDPELPARPAPFHGLGWMEGYARVVGEVVAHVQEGCAADAPTLQEHLDILRCLLGAAQREATA